VKHATMKYNEYHRIQVKEGWVVADMIRRGRVLGRLRVHTECLTVES